MVLDIPNGLFGQEDVRETPDAGIVGTETRYYSINPSDFISQNPDVNDIAILYYRILASANGIVFCAPVHLPHGALITNVVVYGNAGAGAETWTLKRIKYDETGDGTLATANINSADNSVVNGTVDNLNYTYAIFTTSLDSGDRINGGVITYTITEPYP